MLIVHVRQGNDGDLVQKLETPGAVDAAGSQFGVCIQLGHSSMKSFCRIHFTSTLMAVSYSTQTCLSRLGATASAYTGWSVLYPVHAERTTAQVFHNLFTPSHAYFEPTLNPASSEYRQLAALYTSQARSGNPQRLLWNQVCSPVGLTRLSWSGCQHISRKMTTTGRPPVRPSEAASEFNRPCHSRKNSPWPSICSL